MAASRFCGSWLPPLARASRRSLSTFRPAAAEAAAATTWSSFNRQPASAAAAATPVTKIAARNYFIMQGSKHFTRADYEFHSLLLLKTFDKVDPEKVSLEAHFKNDLGLDSLDHVEIVMIFEDHFCVHIEDHEAEQMFTLRQVVDYMMEFNEVDKPQYIYPHKKAGAYPEI